MKYDPFGTLMEKCEKDLIQKDLFIYHIWNKQMSNKVGVVLTNQYRIPPRS